MKPDLIKRLQLLNSNPEMIKPLDNTEMQDLLFMFLTHITKLQSELDKGNLKGDDGYTPIPDKDYMSEPEARKMLTQMFNEAYSSLKNEAQMTTGQVNKIVQDKLDSLKDGKDAEISDELIQKMVDQTLESIVLPDFANLMTAEPEAVRDALELLQGDERLEQSAIKNLPEDLKKLEDRVNKKMTLVPVGSSSGGTSGPIEGTDILSTGETVGKVLQADGDNSSSWVTLTGGGNALTSNPLSQFAATTSAQLAGVLSDETGTGAAVFANSPALITPTGIVANDLADFDTAVAANSAVTANTAKVTNATHTGDVTGATALTIASGAVTLAKMADLAQDQFIGRTTASTGVPETTTITAAARSVLDDATVSDMVNTLGGASSTGTGGLVRTGSPALVTPSIAAITVSGGTLTLPTGATDTLVSKNSTDTLTNKTLTSPTLTTPNIGVATATSVNKMAITAPATGSTLTIADGKTFTVNQTLTLTGTSGTTMTFPSTSATIARTDAANTFTGVQTMTSPSFTTSVVTGSTSFSAWNTVMTTFNLAGAATTLTIGGTPTTAITHNYSTNATATATTKTVNLGTGGAAGSTSNINIGSSNGGTTTVNSPTLAVNSAITAGGVAVPTISSTSTLTNKTLTTPNIASIKGTLTTDTDGATITFDKNTSDFHNVVLGGNRTLALSNMAAGDRIVLRLTQDGTGSRTVTWFGTIKWAAGGTAPTLTTTASKADVFGFLCTSTGNYDGFVIGQNI